MPSDDYVSPSLEELTWSASFDPTNELTSDNSESFDTNELNSESFDTTSIEFVLPDEVSEADIANNRYGDDDSKPIGDKSKSKTATKAAKAVTQQGFTKQVAK